MNNKDIAVVLDDLFHQFLNAVNNIDFETQTFPLLVKMDGLENTLRYEDKSIKEKIASMLDTAESEYDRSCGLLKSIKDALNKAGIEDLKTFIEDITHQLKELKQKLVSISTMYADMHNNEDAEAILKEFLTLNRHFLSIKEIYDRLKDILISKGIYHAE